MPQHVGVEVAPRQLGGVRRRVGDLGEERARVEHPEVEVGREPRGAVVVGAVALVPVVAQAVVAEGPPAAPGGVLAGAGQLERRLGHRLLQQVQCCLVGVGRLEVGGAGRAGGLGPAVLAPGAGEGAEHLVGPAAAVADQPRPHGVRRPGRDELDLLGHGLVAAPAVRRRLGGDVHPPAVGHLRHDLAGVAVADGQRDPVGEREHVGGQPCPAGRARRGPDGRVDDEERGRRPLLERGEEGRVVAHPQVATEPHHR